MPKSIDSDTPPIGLKEALFDAVISALNRSGYRQSRWVKLLEIRQTEVSALKNRDAGRFSVERLIRILARLRHDVSIDITPGAGSITVNTRAETLTDLTPLRAVRNLVSAEPGIVLISGISSGRTKMLHAILQEHTLANSVLLYSASERHPAIRTVPFTSDLDLEQREIFTPDTVDVIGVDWVSSSKASAYTVLHFAKRSRVYAAINAGDGKRAVDEFLALTGPPRSMGDTEHVMPWLRGVIAVREYPTLDGRGIALAAEVSRVIGTRHGRFGAFDLDIDQTFEDEERRLLSEGRISRGFVMPVAGGPITSVETAKRFLETLGSRLSPDFHVADDPEDTLGINVIDVRSGASVAVSLEKDRNRAQYDAFITTDDPEHDLQAPGESIPETRLFGAPTDVEHIEMLARRFFASHAP